MIDLAKTAMRYRRQRNDAWSDRNEMSIRLAESQASCHRLAAQVADLQRQLAVMDATNAGLSREAVARDMKPMGRFGDAS